MILKADGEKALPWKYLFDSAGGQPTDQLP
jgi:hypothetical protein